MPDGRDPLTVRVLTSLSQVPQADWDACAGPENPFVSHAFLSALEDSGSATAETGWLAQHLAIADHDGRLAGVAPLYLKNHSYGEYVFDWGWAEAYERAGRQYYPKLQCAVPFTPVTGPRLLLRPDSDQALYGTALVAAMGELAKQGNTSSLHITFCTADEAKLFRDHGFLTRSGLQYHWHNPGYRDFEDFLAQLVSRKRKAIRRERRQVHQSGVRVKMLTGADIKPAHWEAFYRFYLATVDKRWAHAYLTREFFLMLGETLGEQVALVVAEEDGEIIAGALNLIGGDTLYGRNWGAGRHKPFLHFEACYYQAIDFAIEHGLKCVEAGAQGVHKIQRGYLPSKTHSAHRIADAGFQDAVSDFLERERRGMALQKAALDQESPFRKGEPYTKSRY